MYKFSSQTRRGISFALALSMAMGSLPIPVWLTVRASEPEAPVSLNVSTGQNYRNLNMTPGGDNSIMRFTWHSGSEAGSIRIWPQGNPDAARTIETTSQVAESRREAALNAATPLIPTRAGYAYFVHQVSVYELDAQTTYEYVVVWEGGESAPKRFSTGGGSEFQFIVAGDPQLGVNFAGQTLEVDYEGWRNTIDIATSLFDPEFILSIGDQVHTTGNAVGREVLVSQERHDALFAPTQFHSIPLIPLIGNHDGGGINNANIRMFPLHYNIPETASNVRRHNAEANAFYTHLDYYFRWGNILIVHFDSNTQTGFGPDGPRTRWIEEVLDRNQDATWRIGTWHHSSYPVRAFNHDGVAGSYSIINNLVHNVLPQIERMGFDVVLTGHEHSYSRSHHMLGNVPQLNQQFIDAQGNLVSEQTNAVYNPTGITHITLNSTSGSGFYGIRRIQHRYYIATYNQNFRRNFSVVDVTDYQLSVATYQVNNDGSTTLVDVYTIVNDLNQVTGTRQMGYEELIGFAVADLRGLPVGTTFDEIVAQLPETVNVETNLRNNNDDNGALVMRNAGYSQFGMNVSPAYAPVVWNKTNTDFDESATQQTFTITGTADIASVYTRYGRPVAVGNPRNIPMTVELQVTIGDRVAPDGFAYVSYLGARYRFYGRTSPDFLYDAFDPELFSQWEGGGDHPAGHITPIGFGYAPAASGLLLDGHALPVGPGSANRGTPPHTWTYFSRTFTLPEDFTPGQIGEVFGYHRVNSRMVLFVNGIEVYRFNTANPNHGGSAAHGFYNVTAIDSPTPWQLFGGFNMGGAFTRDFEINENFNNRISSHELVNSGGVPQGLFARHAASRYNLYDALRPGENVVTAVVGVAGDWVNPWFDLEMLVEILPTARVLTHRLTSLLVEAEERIQSYYTAESWEVLQQAVRHANDVLTSLETYGEGNQENIDDAYAQLNEAIENLEIAPLGLEDLRALIALAETRSASNYTMETWSVFTEALTTARAVLANGHAIQETIDAAYEALVLAMENLEPIPGVYASISYFGARYRFYGRTDNEFLYDAFNPAAFADWLGGGDHPEGQPTPIGFGNPMGGSGLSLDSGHRLPATGGSAAFREVAGHPHPHKWFYFSRTFDLPDDFTTEQIGRIFGQHEIDDRFILFINGQEVYRFNTANVNHAWHNRVEIGIHTPWGITDGRMVFGGFNTGARRRTFEIADDQNHFASGYTHNNNAVAAGGLNLLRATSRTNMEAALRPGQNVVTALVGTSADWSGDVWFNLDMQVELLPQAESDNNEALETLTALMDEIIAMELIEEDFTAESWSAFSSALAQAATILLEGGNLSAIIEATERLQETLANLEYTYGEDADDFDTPDFGMPVVPAYPEWEADMTFDNGDRVLYNGRVFQAQWWTQNVNPATSGPWGAWMEIGAPVYIGGVYAPIWTESRVFDNGDLAVYNGQVFRAQWWTRNHSPSTLWGPWVLVGNITE